MPELYLTLALLTLEFCRRCQVPRRAFTGPDVELRDAGTQQGVIDILRTQEPSRNMRNFRGMKTGHCLCCFVYGGLVLLAIHTRAGQALG